MRDENSILAREEDIVRSIQGTIRRELDRRREPTLTAIAIDSQLSYSTVCSWLNAEKNKKPAALSVAALRCLIEGQVPIGLLSLLLPDGFQIVRASETIDHDALCEWCEGYVATKTKAHRADSAMGTQIAPCEQAELDSKVAYLPIKGKAA